MRYDTFKPLLDAVTNETLTRQQIEQLLGAAIARACSIEAPELEAAQQDLSEAFEAIRAGLNELDLRDARRAA